MVITDFCGEWSVIPRRLLPRVTPRSFLSRIAQMGERQTEDLKVAGSIPASSTSFFEFSIFRFCFVVFWSVRLAVPRRLR